MSISGSSPTRPRADRRSSSWALALAGLAALYIATRLALVWRFPVFWDEGLYAAAVGTAREDFGQYAMVALLDQKGPLQTWLGVGVSELGFGALTALRLVSVAVGAALVACTALLARDLTGRKATGLIAALFAVALPLPLVLTTLGLAEGIIGACTAAALWLSLRLARRPDWRTAGLLGAALAAGLLTKTSAAMAAALAPVALLARRPPAHDAGPPAHDAGPPAPASSFQAWGVRALAAVVAAFALAALPRLSVFYGGDGVLQLPHYRSLPDVFNHFGAYSRHGWPIVGATLRDYFGLPVLAASVLGLAALAFRPLSRGAAVFLAVATVLPLVATAIFAWDAYPRYLVSAIPPLVVLAAVGVESAATVSARWVSSPRTALALVTVAVLAVPAVLSARVVSDPATTAYPRPDRVQYVTGWSSGLGLETAASKLIEATSPGRYEVASDKLAPFGLASAIGDPRWRITNRRRDADAPVEARREGRTFVFLQGGSRQRLAKAPFIYHDYGLEFAGRPRRAYGLIYTYTRPRGSTILLARAR